MAPLALALHLALAAPGPSPGAPASPALAATAPATTLAASPPTFAPRLDDPGPFRGKELAMGSLGVLTGDLLVVGAGYLTLQLFASNTISPTAENFRRSAYVLGATALLVPPLTAALFARLAGGPGSGRLWKAVLLATAGHAASLVAAYALAPRFYLGLPVQLAVVSAGASLGLHWGPRDRAAGSERPGSPAAEGTPPAAAGPALALFTPICPDR